MKKALFITLDDTLVTTLSGRPYPIHGEDWKFISKTLPVIKEYHSKGYLICIITNQVGIHKGLILETMFLRKMELIVATLERDLDLKVNDITYNYSTIPFDYDYLPNPGLLYSLAVDYDIDVVNSTLIGNCEREKLITKTTGIKNYIDVHTLKPV